MSPRRKVDPDETDFFAFTVDPPRRWGMVLISLAASLLIAAALTAGTLMLISHERDHRTAVNDAQALGYVREFMVGYTSLDPFHANAYVDRILSAGTGDFHKQFTEKKNEILIRVAQAEPTQGTVVDAGVQRWSDDGSADVLVATKVTSKSPDGKQTIESGNRWVVTATREGQQWKISQLIQVI
jgi:Mce-associated membrane protein